VYDAKRQYREYEAAHRGSRDNVLASPTSMLERDALYVRKYVYSTERYEDPSVRVYLNKSQD